jgi:hypothetical protein
MKLNAVCGSMHDEEEKEEEVKSRFRMSASDFLSSFFMFSCNKYCKEVN